MFRHHIEKHLELKQIQRKSFGIFFFTVLFIFGNAYSEEFNYKQEMDKLKTRVEQLEEKEETPLNNISFHGVMVGNVQSYIPHIENALRANYS